jgi:peptidoglycan/xylan/chitin deacetylase (PgdA/CDA1 family)
MAQENPASALKHKLRQIVKSLAVRGGGLGLYHRLRHREMLTVLMFHRVLPQELIAGHGVDEEYTISTALLESLMKFAAANYSIVDLPDVLESRRRQSPLPSYPLLITFDDGWDDNATYAAPILAAAGMPWTLFAATDAISSGTRWWQEALLGALRAGETTYDDLMAAALAAGGGSGRELPTDRALAILTLYGTVQASLRADLIARHCGKAGRQATARDMADWETLRVLQNAGVAIGGHGASHLPLTAIADPLGDLAEATRVMRHHLGDEACTTMSFPHGLYNPAIAEGARNLGTQLMFTSDPILNHCPGGWLQSDLLGRISISTAAIAAADGQLDAERVMPWLMLRP